MYMLREFLKTERWQPYKRDEGGQSQFIAYCVSDLHMQHTQCPSHEAWLHLPQMWPTYTDTCIVYSMKDLLCTHTHDTHLVHLYGEFLYTSCSANYHWEPSMHREILQTKFSHAYQHMHACTQSFRAPLKVNHTIKILYMSCWASREKVNQWE